MSPSPCLMWLYIYMERVHTLLVFLFSTAVKCNLSMYIVLQYIISIDMSLPSHSGLYCTVYNAIACTVYCTINIALLVQETKQIILSCTVRLQCSMVLVLMENWTLNMVTCCKWCLVMNYVLVVCLFVHNIYSRRHGKYALGDTNSSGIQT